MDVLKKVPVREQDAKERATNFKEVCLGYNKEEAIDLTQNLCQWLYDNNFTCSKLSLINNS